MQKFRIGDIIWYRSGIKWQKVGLTKWTCLDGGRFSTYAKGEIKEVLSDSSVWIAKGYKLISLNKYVKEINSYISETGN